MPHDRGARQSRGAHALWHALARRHALGYVDLRNKMMTDLGREVSAETLDGLHTRMLLPGNGWATERFRETAEMRSRPDC